MQFYDRPSSFERVKLSKLQFYASFDGRPSFHSKGLRVNFQDCNFTPVFDGRPEFRGKRATQSPRKFAFHHTYVCASDARSLQRVAPQEGNGISPQFVRPIRTISTDVATGDFKLAFHPEGHVLQACFWLPLPPEARIQKNLASRSL